MSVIVCHPGLAVVTPDVVAECWEGVSDALYAALWDCVPLYGRIDIEDCGPADVVGVNSVEQFWSRFAPTLQTELNALAAAHDDALARWSV